MAIITTIKIIRFKFKMYNAIYIILLLQKIQENLSKGIDQVTTCISNFFSIYNTSSPVILIGPKKFNVL